MKGKFTNNFPILGKEISIILLFFLILEIEIWNIFQLPKFWEVKSEIYIFSHLSGREKRNQNPFPTGKLSGSNAKVWIQYLCQISKGAQLKQIELNKRLKNI